MKIKIAFLAPYNNTWIGGGDRKYLIYFAWLDPEHFEKYFICVHNNTTTIAPQKADEIVVSQLEALEFLEDKGIEFVYLAWAPLSAEVENVLLQKYICLYNVNFTTRYRKEPNLMNLIISKTDYWKLAFIHKELQNSFVVYNPIAVDNRIQLSHEAQPLHRKPLSDKKIVIGRLARAEPSKRHFHIIATLCYLQKHKNYQYWFIFAGMPYLYRKVLKLLLRKKMYESIVFLPELRDLKDIASFYASIDIFRQTSRIGESFWNVIAEAFCFKKPVITDFKDFYNDGHIRPALYDAQIELVDHGKNGWYCVYPEVLTWFLDQATPTTIQALWDNWYAKAKGIYNVIDTCRTLAKVIYNIGKQRGIYTTDQTFENIQEMPWEKELETYKEVYLERIKQCHEVNAVSTTRKILYTIQERIRRGIEYGYLAARKILLQYCKTNIEKF